MRFPHRKSAAGLRALNRMTTTLLRALQRSDFLIPVYTPADARRTAPDAADTSDVADVECKVLDRAAPCRRPQAPAAPHTPPLGDAPDKTPAKKPAPLRGSFIAGVFANAQGERPYKLFIPPNDHGGPLPLVVMLHGCKQDPDDFAAGTRMNLLAQEQLCFVLYPAQAKSANRSRCWNWYLRGDQARDRGEPSIIAEMTRHVIGSHAIDPARVYIAGLSAGGAMAATMAATYPELYAAAGVHSGLPHAAAHDLMTALAVMRQGGGGSSDSSGTIRVPTIIFHGDRDTTVHPCNAERVALQARPSDDGMDISLRPHAIEVERVDAPGAHAYTRTLHRDVQGRIQVEHWLIHGAAHTWSGGSPKGSFTDPGGPDASAEMLRFFSQYAQPRI